MQNETKTMKRGEGIEKIQNEKNIAGHGPVM